MICEYNGGLTREQFLFYEIRIVASLQLQGLSREEIVEEIKHANLFQFPTERMISSIAGTCFKRLDALGSETLVYHLIGEKFRTQELAFSGKDLNIFFFDLQEQNDTVASWRDSTINKIKQVLKKALVECEYLDSVRATQLNPVSVSPELEDEIRANHDLAALPAFNCFR